MKKNPYMQYNYQVLVAWEESLKKEVKDSSLTLKEQSNARKNLKLVQEAIKTK